MRRAIGWPKNRKLCYILLVFIINPYGYSAPTIGIEGLSHLVSCEGVSTSSSVVKFLPKMQGVVYQTFSHPLIKSGEKVMNWGGILHAIFIDEQGLFREDGNKNGKLDDYNSDKIIELTWNPNKKQTMLQRYTITNGDKVPLGDLAPLHTLQPIWEAREPLSRLTNLTKQREYSALASSGRYIATWMDKNNNQEVDDGELEPFVGENFSSKYNYLNTSTEKTVGVVNYIRGKDALDLRSRTIDYDADGREEVWRLGDMIHSTPTVVSAPSAAYDTRFGDSSYTAFKNKYSHRRHVVYIGANDGLIHAFNGGFWNQDSQRYTTIGSQGETNHPLGSELWAYAPMNLLPHMQRLSAFDYEHVYYMDGVPQVFDVNIFPSNEDHPNGWGTILVIGMGLGGTAVDVTIDGQQQTMRSGYIVLDITNPEKPPSILAEITAPELGFTVAKPSLIKQRAPGPDGSWTNTATNNWYLAFASGPDIDNPSKVHSTQNLKIFIYDLRNKNFVNGFDPFVSKQKESYGGSMTTVDWNQDYHDDAVYFGSISGSGPILSGALNRLKVHNIIEKSWIAKLIDTEKPMTAKPYTVADGDDYWVYAGTGRLLTNNDHTSKRNNSFYAVKEPVDTHGMHSYFEVSVDNLVNTTNIVVETSGQVNISMDMITSPLIIGGQRVNSFNELKSIMKRQQGWVFNLNGNSQNPSGKILSSASSLFSMIMFSEHIPSYSACQNEGTGYLHGLHYITGTSIPNALLGVDIKNKSTFISSNKVAMEISDINTPIVIFDNKDTAKIFIQKSDGNLTSQKIQYPLKNQGRQSWRQIFGIY